MYFEEILQFKSEQLLGLLVKCYYSSELKGRPVDLILLKSVSSKDRDT